MVVCDRAAGHDRVESACPSYRAMPPCALDVSIVRIGRGVSSAVDLAMDRLIVPDTFGAA